jgi:hypothetical protein
MKRSALILALALPAFSAAISAAQIIPVRFSAPVNPVVGLPTLRPSPLASPLVGARIELPSLLPSLTPSPALLAAAAPAVLPASPSRENASNPLRRIMPGMIVGLSEQTESPKASPEADKDRLGQVFDGDGRPVKPGANGPIGSERRISLPEDDLMRELGI